MIAGFDESGGPVWVSENGSKMEYSSIERERERYCKGDKLREKWSGKNGQRGGRVGRKKRKKEDER